MALTIIATFIGCVGPPDYDDGLLENIPAVVNDNDYFSISVLGDKYTELNEWNLEIDVDIEDEILTTLIVKENVNLTMLKQLLTLRKSANHFKNN